DVVELVDVDVVGLHSPEALVEGATDVERRQPALVRPVAHLAVDLGGEDGSLPSPTAGGEPAAEDPLGATPLAVDVGRVEEVDAVVVGRVHDLVRVGLAGPLAEVHGAK